VAYDLAVPDWPQSWAWVVPLAFGAAQRGVSATASIALLCLAGMLLQHRTRVAEARLADYHTLRDRLTGLSASLARRNRDLLARQDMDAQLATLAERSRIAREIHDNVGHVLTRAVLQVEALKVAVPNGPVHDSLERLGETVKGGLDSVRESVHDLHAEGFDLEQQLRALAEAAPGIEVSVNYAAEDVPAQVGYTFLAVAREALSNSSRHSDATRLRVSVIEHPGLFQLVAQDDGTKPPPGGAPAGIGLQSMEDRARSLGGAFSAGYSGGFRVFVSVPKTAGAKQGG
jgi:signal transduction histidine kinase